jgi:hypothetical protein
MQSKFLPTLLLGILCMGLPTITGAAVVVDPLLEVQSLYDNFNRSKLPALTGTIGGRAIFHRKFMASMIGGFGVPTKKSVRAVGGNGDAETYIGINTFRPTLGLGGRMITQPDLLVGAYLYGEGFFFYINSKQASTNTFEEKVSYTAEELKDFTNYYKQAHAGLELIFFTSLSFFTSTLTSYNRWSLRTV